MILTFNCGGLCTIIYRLFPNRKREGRKKGWGQRDGGREGQGGREGRMGEGIKREDKMKE